MMYVLFVVTAATEPLETVMVGGPMFALGRTPVTPPAPDAARLIAAFGAAVTVQDEPRVQVWPLTVADAVEDAFPLNPVSTYAVVATLVELLPGVCVVAVVPLSSAFVPLTAVPVAP
jgi:hypothetical protein